MKDITTYAELQVFVQNVCVLSFLNCLKDFIEKINETSGLLTKQNSVMAKPNLIKLKNVTPQVKSIYKRLEGRSWR